MAVKLIEIPAIHPNPRPRCQADVQMVGDWAWQWRTNAVEKRLRRYSGVERVTQCTHSATVEIDGVPMCRRHAGQLVLERYIKGDLVDKHGDA